MPPLDINESLVPFTFSVNSAYAYDDDSIILGTTRGTFWISNDKGKNWARRSTPLEGLGMNLSNVAMKDEMTFMVAGDTEQVTFNGMTTVSFTTTDGGVNWIEGSPGVTAAATHYIPNTDGVFIMVGHNDFGWGSEGTAISYDYGENWEILDNLSLIAIDFTDENTGYGGCCNNIWPTANGQIHKWSFDVPTSTFEVVKSDLVELMPNPVRSDLFIETNEFFTADHLTLEIFSANGEVVHRAKVLNDFQLKVSVTNLPKGIYSIRITDDRKSVINKFIKQ